MRLSLTTLCPYVEGHCAECSMLFVVMLSVVMLNVVILGAVILNVIMLSAMAPFSGKICIFSIDIEYYH